jgi:disulfide bond formation protein DsbB
MPRFSFYLLHFNIVAVCGVLLGAFAVQLGSGELPCPLCSLQRMAMLLCVLGPAFIITRVRHGGPTDCDFAAGYGASVLAAVVGAAISGRQVLLHIVPGHDTGFGEPVLGLHLYTWAFVVFVTVLIVSGMNLVFITAMRPRDVRFGKLSAIVLGLVAIVTLANAASMLALEGLHATLPDEPDRYRLFEDLQSLLGR